MKIFRQVKTISGPNLYSKISRANIKVFLLPQQNENFASLPKYAVTMEALLYGSRLADSKLIERMGRRGP